MTNGQHTAVKAAAGGSMAEGFIGLCAVALGIIAFANIAPAYLLPIGIIAAGAALIFEGGTIAARYNRLEQARGSEVTKGGTVTQFVLGAAAVALGALGLGGIAPAYLIPIAVICLGVGLLLDGGTNARLNAMEVRHMRRIAPTIPVGDSVLERRAVPDIEELEMAREAEIANVGIASFVGMGVLTLGILALIGIQPMILCLAALLGVGLTQFFVSAAAGTMLGFSK